MIYLSKLKTKHNLNSELLSLTLKDILLSIRHENFIHFSKVYIKSHYEK